MRRESRLTKAQRQALDRFWDRYGIAYNTEELNIPALFQRRAPLILDIGVGNGDSTVEHALRHRENNYIAIEVHRPGIGQLLRKINAYRLNNIKIINHGVIEVLRDQIPTQSVSQVFIFFPDPWPKKRHHKRRLINKNLIELLKNILCRHGRIHIATDWQDYAEQISMLLAGENGFINLAGNSITAPRPTWRTKTRYEIRGLNLNHEVRDFCYAPIKRDQR